MEPSLAAQLADIAIERFAASPDITADTPFAEMDFDSLVLAEMSVYLTDLFGVQVTDDDLYAAGTLARTATLLAACLGDVQDQLSTRVPGLAQP